MSTGNTITQYSYGSGLYGGRHGYGGDFYTSRGMLPMCHCQKPMVIYIANTLEHQGRRFWRCCIWQKRNRPCDLFIWDDELGPGTRPMVAVPSNVSIAQSKEGDAENLVDSKPNTKCTCGDDMQGIWDKKKDQWKVKLLDEKKKVEWLKWILIASWVFFVVMYGKK